MKRPVASITLIGSCMVTATALGQGLPDLAEGVTQSGQLRRAAEASIKAARPLVAEGETALPGEAGVFLLRVNEIFFVAANGSLGYTDNPDRNADNVSGDEFTEASVTTGVSTRLGETVDFGLSANLGGREYFERDSASNRNLSGTVSAGVPLTGPVYLGVVGYGGWNYDNDFDDAVGFYGAAATLSAAIPLGQRLVLRPAVTVNRQLSEESENESTTVSGGLEAFLQAAPGVTVSARVAMSRRWFDNFYEDVTYVERKEWTTTVAASVSWQPVEYLTIGALIGYEKQVSDFYLSSYDAYETAALVNFALHF